MTDISYLWPRYMAVSPGRSDDSADYYRL